MAQWVEYTGRSPLSCKAWDFEILPLSTVKGFFFMALKMVTNMSPASRVLGDSPMAISAQEKEKRKLPLKHKAYHNL